MDKIPYIRIPHFPWLRNNNYIKFRCDQCMTRVKFYSNQQLSEIEKSINEFLKRDDVKQLVDIKFSAVNKDGNNEYTALIIYEENVNLGKEDPQMYE